jgi:cation transport regulator
MPYASNDDLPRSVREHLPAQAQDIFRGAFNSAWRTYGKTDPAHVEEIAHRVAWAAVKKRYRKLGETWVRLGKRQLRRGDEGSDDTVVLLLRSMLNPGS